MITSNFGKLSIQLLIVVACTSAAQADSMSFLSSDTLPLNLTQAVALQANTQTSWPAGAGYTSIADYLYLMGDVGVEMTQDVNMKNALGLTGVQFGLDTGMRFDLGVGYDVTSWFSVEATAGLIWNSISTISGTLTSGNIPFNLNTTGDLYNVPIMVNGKFRIPITKEANSPQLVFGGGVGALWSQYDLDTIAGFSLNNSSSAWAFAYQATAGVEWKLGNNLHLGVAYAFLGTSQLDYEFVTADALYTHSILATIRYEF